MIDSTFSRATWLNSLHMSTLTLSLLEKEGFAREQLLEGSGITPADLLDLRRLISPWQEQQVFANACRLSDEPALGLRLGLRTRISAYGLLGYALLSAPTLGEALRIGLSYPVLLGTYFHLSLEVADGRAWLVATGYGEDEALRPFNTELCLGSLKVTCADLLGQPLPLLEAASTMPATRRWRGPTPRVSPASCTSNASAAPSASPPNGWSARCRWPTR